MLFVEANPIPLKKALQLMGIIKSAECRLPLVTLADVHTEKLKKCLKSKGLI
jgi:4-hydroxy-tetrahydrodipicolinate synthase